MDDWRLNGNFDDIKHQHFTKKYFKSTEKNDHEHCCFCWIKITDQSLLEECVSFGYVTRTKYGQENWICEKCFNDFKEKFNLIEDNK